MVLSRVLRVRVLIKKRVFQNGASFSILFLSFRCFSQNVFVTQRSRWRANDFGRLFWVYSLYGRVYGRTEYYTARNSSLLLSRAMRSSFRLCTGLVRGSLYWANSTNSSPRRGRKRTLSLLDASLFMASLNFFSASSVISLFATPEKDATANKHRSRSLTCTDSSAGLTSPELSSTTNCIFRLLFENTGVVISIFSFLSFFPKIYPANRLNACPASLSSIFALPVSDFTLVSATKNFSYSLTSKSLYRLNVAYFGVFKFSGVFAKLNTCFSTSPTASVLKYL
mmetsp:Transcript_892/g.2589  ORF Transcript_892/g.2589 Transcript_892/m.2589 type:complete len:282 (+) Transcript_892:303-1148(+)